jgi:hypothetical protein
MKWLFRLVTLAAVGALAVWLWTVLFPGPETLIHNRLNKVAALLSFAQDEGRLSRLAKAQRLGAFFSPDIEISIDTPGLSQHTVNGRDELTQHATAVAMALGSLRVHLVDVKIGLSADKTEATVSLTAEALVQGEPTPSVQEFKIAFRKIDGEWLIVRVQSVRALS